LTPQRCGHLVPAGRCTPLLAQHHKQIFPHDLFVDLFEFEQVGLSIPTDQIVSAMVLKELESDLGRSLEGVIRRSADPPNNLQS
jgi:hypothetical protein